RMPSLEDGVSRQERTNVNQHFVPQFYLRHFADPARPKEIWVYEKGVPGPERRPIKDVAFREHFYSIPNPDGSIDTDFDGALGEVENLFAPILRRIVSRVMRQESPDQDDDLVWLRVFVAAMHARVPRFRRQLLRQIADGVLATDARPLDLRKRHRVVVHRKV